MDLRYLNDENILKPKKTVKTLFVCFVGSDQPKGILLYNHPQVMVGFIWGTPPGLLETSMWVDDKNHLNGYFCLQYLLFKEPCVYCYLLEIIGKISSYIRILTLDCWFRELPISRTRLQSWGIVGAKNDTHIVLLK